MTRSACRTLATSPNIGDLTFKYGPKSPRNREVATESANLVQVPIMAANSGWTNDAAARATPCLAAGPRERGQGGKV